jgi:hypothetical protein
MSWTTKRETGRRRTLSRITISLVIALALGASTAALPITPAVRADASSVTPVPIPADAPWLAVVNYYRAVSGLGSVTEEAIWSQGAHLHGCYMLLNGMSHDEIPGRPGYTEAGRAAGLNGNVAVSSNFDMLPRRAVELWMTGPFHAIGILRPNLKKVGFGICRNSNTTPYRAGATLDILRGLDYTVPRSNTPVLFPGDGSTTNLDRFYVESPSPLTFCGWPNGGGLPTIAMMPENFTSVTGSITGPNGPLQTCTLSRLNTSGVAQAILAGDNAVVVMPRDPLAPGTYRVTARTSARTVSWSFTVDPAVADAPLAPVPNTQVIGPSSGFVPLQPRRIVDTRTAVGTTRLVGGQSRPIQVTGRGGVPGGSTAVSANLTVVGSAAAGYLTVFPCGTRRPIVASVNFGRRETVGNAAIVPLDANGRFCAFSNTDVDLVVDVNGALASNATASHVSAAPSRLFDTANRYRAPGRIAARSVLRVNVTAPGTGVPSGAAAVVLSLTGVRPSNATFITAWPCGARRPTVSNLNLRKGETRTNMAVVPLPADGMLCLYSEAATDLVGDLTGYLVPNRNAQSFTPLAPVRLVDTRDGIRLSLNHGLLGSKLNGGSAFAIPVSGTRGVPQSAKAVSLNVTTTGAGGSGFVTVYPCSLAAPTAVTVSLRAGRTIPSAVTAHVSPGGSICVYSSDPTHIVVDINGYWS